MRETSVRERAQALSDFLNRNRENIQGGYGGESQVDLIESALLLQEREALERAAQYIEDECVRQAQVANQEEHCLAADEFMAWPMAQRIRGMCGDSIAWTCRECGGACSLPSHMGSWERGTTT